MKNWEKYEKELKELGLDFGVKKGTKELINCYSLDCESCGFDAMNCGKIKSEWLYQEAQPTLTKKERAIVEAIAEDEDYDVVISRYDDGIYIEVDSNIQDKERYLQIDDDLFIFIPIGEHRAVEDLLELEVKND